MSKIKSRKRINKKSNNVNNSRSKFSKLINKISNIKNKKLIGFSTILVLGIALIPTSMVLGLDFEKYSTPQIVRQKFPKVLLAVKNTVEHDFEVLIEDMKEDPLNGLLLDKLPTPEEIFFEEWANDWFPDINITVIGGYIESIGAKAVGDIDLDGKNPSADLNITSCNHPSEILLEQCRALWDPQTPYSLVFRSPSIWFSALEGNQNDRDLLEGTFNLTEFQLELVLGWINRSRNTWLPNLAQEDRLTMNPLLLFGLITPGVVLIGFSTPKIRNEIKTMKLTSKKEFKPKKTEFKDSE